MFIELTSGQFGVKFGAIEIGNYGEPHQFSKFCRNQNYRTPIRIIPIHPIRFFTWVALRWYFSNHYPCITKYDPSTPLSA